MQYVGRQDTLKQFTGVTRATSSSVAAAHEVGAIVQDLFPPPVAGAKFIIQVCSGRARASASLAS